MIRRNLPLGTDPQQWLLISQIEHARFSRTLAERWGNGEVSPVIGKPDESNPAQLQVRGEVLEAIFHHDDGWVEWEAAPALDSESGRPLDFMEMPQSTATDIWEKSIRAAHREGSLAGWMVAGHFLALLDNSHHDVEAETAKWRDDIEKKRAAWLESWKATNTTLHTRGLANQSLRWLQLSDWLSLWLCCTCPIFQADASVESQPLELKISDSPLRTIRFQPNVSSSGIVVLVDPWPFDSQEFTLTAACKAVPARLYRSTAELVAAYQSRELKWQLCRI